MPLMLGTILWTRTPVQIKVASILFRAPRQGSQVGEGCDYGSFLNPRASPGFGTADVLLARTQHDY